MGQFTNTNGTALVYDFTPSTGTVYKDATTGSAFARDIVTYDACNQCHYKLVYGSNNTSGHFGSRPDTKVCVICHTPQLSGTVSATTLAESGNFTAFIHQIHMGEELPVNTVTPVGIGVAEFKFPQLIKNCTVCHKGADVNNWNTKPTLRSCGSCHNGIVWSTGKGTPLNSAYAAIGHVGGAQTDDKTCASCHPAASVKTYHQSNDVTGNNPTIPTTVADIQYAITSATINASRQPVIAFTIKKDGTNVVLDTPVPATQARRLPMGAQGFKGGPTIGVYFGVPQDGITPADFNSSFTASLTNLWRGLGGTVVKNVDGSYTATLTGTVSGTTATAATVPTTAKVITATVYGTFTQAIPFRAYSTGNEAAQTGDLVRNSLFKTATVTGSTARRAIVADSLCNKCHDQLGIKPSFHGGARNNAPACAFCHTPNRASSGWSAGSSNFIHAIHGSSKRSTNFNWQYALSYWKVGYPGILKNCEQCHLPGTYDFSATASAGQVSNLLYITVATGTNLDNTTAGSSVSPYVTKATNYGVTGFGYNVNTGVTTRANNATLVNSPIASACYACHDTNAAKGHMEQNGGFIYKPRSTAFANYSVAGGAHAPVPAQTEACLVCHGALSTTNVTNTTTPATKAVHRWW
jgi:OmcA/MtrC family decaheme c-type cytochrome